MRIRILRSVLVTNGSGSGSCSSPQWPSRRQQKFLFWRFIYIILKRLKVIKKSQNSRNLGFSSFVRLLMEGSGAGTGSVQINYVSGCGSRRTKIFGSGAGPWTLIWSLLAWKRSPVSYFELCAYFCGPVVCIMQACAWQCCGTVTIFYGSGSDFWKVMVPVPTVDSYGSGSYFWKVPVPVQLHIYTIKSKFFLNLFPFYIVSCFTRKKIININKFIVKCERKKF